MENAGARLATLIAKLEGRSPAAGSTRPSTSPTFDSQTLDQVKTDLIALSSLEPQARGYAFEKFLKDLVDAYGLAAQEAFRNRSEQINGSFQLGNETYLLETKWQGQAVGVAELHTFHGKLEQKAAWTRELFVSNSGFTEEGLTAFGRGKRVVCMDGYDLYETLNRGLPLQEVLSLEVRRAAETGFPFIRVRDLYPH